MEEFVNIVEYYDKNGVCRKRTANGVDLPADTEPSVVFLMQDCAWAIQKTRMTREDVKNRYPLMEKLLCTS